jgi:hypothetical protein
MDVTFPEGFAVVTAGREEAVFVEVSIPGIDELVFAFTQSTTSLNSAWSHHPPPPPRPAGSIKSILQHYSSMFEIKCNKKIKHFQNCYKLDRVGKEQVHREDSKLPP